MRNQFYCIVLVFGLIGSHPSFMFAESWPTYKHDAHRSGVTSESLTLPLQPLWTVHTGLPPQPSWPLPAKQDFWQQLFNLSPRVDYDRVYHTTIAEGRLYYGSSADDQVHCLDAATGNELWTYFTGGPVRVVPTIWNNRIYFGSDDGYVYALDAQSGERVWRYAPDPTDRMIPGNGRLISIRPVRTGVTVEEGVAYCAVGLFPDEHVYICAVEAESGKEIWKHDVKGLAPQGYGLLSPGKWYVPNGRSAPYVFDRRTGESLGTLSGAGGTFALLVDELPIFGEDRTGDLMAFDAGAKERIASFNGLHMVVNADSVFMQNSSEFVMLDRASYMQLSERDRQLRADQERLEKDLKQLGPDSSSAEAGRLRDELTRIKKALSDNQQAMLDCIRWRHPNQHPFALILAGKCLFAGGENQLAAFDTGTGEQLWSADVAGRVYGLAVAEGRLYAGTDTGAIYCFTSASGANPNGG